jgi:hypothetical protein
MPRHASKRGDVEDGVSDPMNDFDPIGEPPEEPETCDRCGSDDLTGGRATYETGVVAPDGYREMAVADFVECRSCGQRWEL